jgi:hypothetical protein
MFLTNDPQITYFKIVYRRHTNFTIEEIRQNFIQISDFGSKVTANISKVGDLMEKTTLVINLPKINPFQDGISQVAWVKNIGYRIIKSISIEINGRTISKNYGEWMYLWNEMFSPLDNKMDKITGNIEELINYSYSKNEYVLYIPLQFWFCRNAGNALPLISMIYSDIKINLEINSLDYCLKITPTHYIKCDADIVNFIKTSLPQMGLQFDIQTSDLHEAQILKLDNSQALRNLSWASRWKATEAIHKTFEWYEKFLSGADAHELTLTQIREFQK